MKGADKVRATSRNLRAVRRHFGRLCAQRWPRFTICAWMCALLLAAIVPLAAEEPETTLKVDVKLVNVFVTVTDANGCTATNSASISQPAVLAAHIGATTYPACKLSL